MVGMSSETLLSFFETVCLQSQLADRQPVKCISDVLF